MNVVKVRLGEKEKIAVPEVVDAAPILNGKSDHNVSANLARTIKGQVSTELSVNDLESILKKHFPPTKINQLLIDMTMAEDTKATKDGDFYQTPNWDARDKALTKILRLLGHIKNEMGAVPDMAPTKIIFNVIHKQVNVEKAEIINESSAD